MPKKASVLFLDRDGTIIEDLLGHYIRRLDQINIIPGADTAIRQAKDAGFIIVIASNQGGIAKGIVSEDMVQKINASLQKKLLRTEATYDLCYYAPSHPDCPNLEYDKKLHWRKPETGMIEQAVKDLLKKGIEIDKSTSYFIGDKVMDVMCGQNWGIKSGLVLTGHAEKERCKQEGIVPDFIADNLYEAITQHVLA
jgi:D-glycero-D-manno-heptose 1,7-bisphosphate phosphatase